MTSEQPRPPLRMPSHLFEELAVGGGSAEALAFLARGERVRRLLLLRTLLARLDAVPTPLDAPAEAWRILKNAAAKDPGRVERLLLAPQTGSWLGHVLRRLHGTAPGPELWAETGHLNAFAVSAALRAGTEADLTVPLADGALILPGLGMARLPGAPPGLSVGRARATGGELTLVSEVTEVPALVLRDPAPVPAAEDLPDPAPHWVPLRTLTLAGPSGTAAAPLDDLDPYRDLDDPIAPARLDAEEAAEWQRLVDEAVGIVIARGMYGPGRLDPTEIRAVVPWGRTSVLPAAPPTVRLSASSGDSYGGMVIARPADPLALAETFIHEFQHSKLGALLHHFRLLDDDREERYYAPWRADPRHLTGLLHGAYAFTGVAGFWRDRMAEARRPETVEVAGYHFALRRTQSRLAVRTLLVSGRLTVQGRAFVGGLARTLDGWLREPVPVATLVRARMAAALHRTEWRLRNVLPVPVSPTAPDTPVFRTDRVSWPDTRTYAFAVPPDAPRTADEYLAAGDPAAALTRYADELSADPDEPHALAGWIVARAALDPGRTTRRMLARPELLQPLPSG
ncbi:HEXXH motif domain-containing protein [Streptomyces xylophagus]|uniref:HEXXH motif domain-containing protein n=1 Tax=Streptomyces xylophagus TaxID=285514 RepID=UPI0005B89C75|nr:HEXXH motif domain-containing protein [Streptomyces xylophagus]